MLQNQFFRRNIVQNFTSQKPLEAAKIRSKRSQSVASLKADPSKFQHREVFDNKIFTKVNFFKMGLNELRQQRRKQQTTSSVTLSQAFVKIGRIMDEPSIVQTFLNYSNHWNLLTQSQQATHVHQGINQILISLLKKIQHKINSILTAKTEIDEKLMRIQSELAVSRKKHVEPSIREEKASFKEQKQKDLKQKNYQLDFFLKKEKLRVRQLQEQIMEKDKNISQLSVQNGKLLLQKEGQVAYHEMMEYKVKRLKQELQVAHIIKEQNLADKMKYIMNW